MCLSWNGLRVMSSLSSSSWLLLHFSGPVNDDSTQTHLSGKSSPEFRSCSYCWRLLIHVEWSFLGPAIQKGDHTTNGQCGYGTIMNIRETESFRWSCMRKENFTSSEELTLDIWKPPRAERGGVNGEGSQFGEDIHFLQCVLDQKPHPKEKSFA